MCLVLVGTEDTKKNETAYCPLKQTAYKQFSIVFVLTVVRIMCKKVLWCTEENRYFCVCVRGSEVVGNRPSYSRMG